MRASAMDIGELARMAGSYSAPWYLCRGLGEGLYKLNGLPDVAFG